VLKLTHLAARAALCYGSAQKQRAVRGWALARLAFDRNLEAREGGIPVAELRSAFATESGVRVTHSDPWSVSNI
jgi:hypothetical protein